MQRITTHVAQNYFDFEAPFLKQRRRLAELVIDAGEILLYQHPTPHAITAQEKLLIRELALECIENGSSGRGNPTLSKQTLRAALEIPDHAIRLAALSFLKSPSSQRLGEIMSATPSHGEIAFATQLLTSPFRDMALLWLLQHPAQSLPGAKQMLYAIGIHNELPSIACLTLASQQRSADPIFTSYALKLFKQANNPLLQVHLINVLARCQPNDCDEERKRLFARKRSDAHLRRGATEGLALLGENGVQVLHKELIESGASSQLSLERTNRFFALRMKFSRPDSNIYTDPHGRRTPVLTSRQSEIIDALALAGPRGGIVVREFLQGFDECDVTHIFHNFLRSANQKWFGLSPDQAASAFNKFCDSHTDLCQ